MATGIVESSVEEACLGWLQQIGFQVLLGPDIAPGEPGAERAEYGESVLVGRLNVALARLNPSLPPAAVEEAVRRALHPDSPLLIGGNHAFHRMLIDGVPVEAQRDDGGVRGESVKLIDFDNPESNDWLAVNQFTVVENGHNRRPDIVIFVNGLPLAVIELKNPADEKADIRAAYNQLQTYKLQIPSLFTFNELLVISDGVAARLGSLTAPFERFSPWRTIEGEDLASSAMPELEVLIRGVFDKHRFLDLIRHFVVFEQDKAEVQKKLAGYHQFHAARKAVATTVAASRPEGDRRIGVVWHTQGSGKSLTMAFYAGKIVTEQAMENPTLVVITDRNDLDDQLFGTFSRCSELLRQTPEQAGDRADLRELLQVGSGGVVFTTIQKFFPEEKGDTYPLLSERRNIVVIADEAHRSQYDFIRGFARHMRDALPNASFIGFTGTPIELEDKSTRAVFGEYISVYDLQRAVEDGATVPIYYESRLAKLDLADAERPKIDPDFEEVTEGEEETRKERLKSKWAQLEAVVGSEKRLGIIAKDLVEHLEDRRTAWEVGKTMIVCMSRRVCVELYSEIVKLRPKWHGEGDEHGEIKVVMTGDATDRVEWQQHIRNKPRREKLANRFRDEKDPFKVVIVRDMWLTGFDVPSLHTMYVDKPMRGHGLMQAIARVNRVFRDKAGGLVVDYLGLADNLRRAMAVYTESGGKGKTVIDQEEAVAAMLERFEICQDVFHGYDVAAYVAAPAKDKLGFLPAAQQHVVESEDRKGRFMKAVVELSKAFALAVPHERALAIRDEVGFFQAVKAYLVKTTRLMETPEEDLDHAIRQIVSRAIAPGEVIDIFAAAGLKKPDISILSDEFLAEVREMPQRNLAVELLQKLLNDELKARSKTNLVQSRSFAEMLERTVRQYQNRAIETAQVIEELIELAREMREAQARGEELGFTDEELAFYDALETNDSAVAVLGDEVLSAIARELADRVRAGATIDWTVKESARAKMRVEVKRILRKYGYPPDKQEKATNTVIEQAELLAEDWAEEPLHAARQVLTLVNNPPEEQRHEKYLPVYGLAAAAGWTDRESAPEPLGWAEVDIGRTLDRQMFITQVHGKSMEPDILDGAHVVFRLNPTGTREGKIVLVQYRGPADPETSGPYTVKRYSSEKMPCGGDSWEHERIALTPANKEFEPLVLESKDADDVRVIAELVAVLG